MDSLLDDLLDEIDDELGVLDEAIPKTALDTNQHKEGGQQVKGSFSSDSDSEGADIDVDGLDDLIADIEKQDSTRRLPKMGPAAEAKPVGRKNPKLRMQRPKGALEGDDLDRILEEIQKVTKMRAAKMIEENQLGWGVVSAERKFDLMAPNCAPPYSLITATLIVTTTGGNRARIPTQTISAKVVPLSPGAPPIRPSITDNKDGTYAIDFESQVENVQYQLQIDVYNQRQFDWDIMISPLPEPSQCIAQVNPAGYRTKIKGEVTLIARDSTGKNLEVGGAQVGLSFAGSGQLTEVGLVDKMDGTYSVTFVPTSPGSYNIFLTVSGIDIKTCPLTINVK